MSIPKLALVAVSIAALCFVTPFVAKGGAQQKRATYGPVVNAYLTGLAEELNELEYQLRHREIARADYDLSKQRLTILRRFVGRLARDSREDQVPELQVLTDDELGTLGLNTRPHPDELEIGDLPDGQWRVIGIERGRSRFFVFLRLPLPEVSSSEGVNWERKSQRKIDPQEVIETIVVRDRKPPAPQPPSTNASPGATGISSQEASTVPPDPLLPVLRDKQKPQIQLPRILHVYLPQYTDKARNNGVEGELIVRALFQSDGKIKNLKVEKGLGYGLDQRAVDAVRRIGFLPAQSEGKDVDAYAQIIFNFKFGKVTFYLKTAEMGVSARGTRP
jgi:TonB family protein